MIINYKVLNKILIYDSGKVFGGRIIKYLAKKNCDVIVVSQFENLENEVNNSIILAILKYDENDFFEIIKKLKNIENIIIFYDDKKIKNLLAEINRFNIEKLLIDNDITLIDFEIKKSDLVNLINSYILNYIIKGRQFIETV